MKNLITKPFAVFLVFVGVLNAQSVDLYWSKQNLFFTNTQSSKSPIDMANKEIATQLNTYLKPRDVIKLKNIPPLVTKPTPPPAVPKPTFTKRVVLTQGKYETKEEFEKRVDEQNKKHQQLSDEKKRVYLEKVKQRNLKIDELTEQFNEDVKRRNHRIQELQELLEEDRQNIKKEQAKKEKNFQKYASIFAKNAFKKYLGNPQVKHSEYFVDKEVMVVTISSSVSDFSQKLSFKIDPKTASRFERDLLKADPKVLFKLHRDTYNNKLSLSLDSYYIGFESVQYEAEPTSGIFSNNYASAKIEIDTALDQKIAIKDLVVQPEYTELKYQKADIQNITYKASKDMHDEILNRLNRLKPSKKVDNRWLFVLGIEDYVEGVDDVIYSKQSAYSFSKVAQKLLGIKEQKSYVLIDTKATSGNIKSKLRQMLSKVRKGDEIYFYYSGHGIPVAKQDNEPYILPQDLDPNYIDYEKFYRLKNIYTMLSNTGAKKIIAVVDSCFSGATDGKSILKGVAASRLVPKKVDGFDKQKMVILTAAQKRQYSNMYEAKKHRLFSYFVMDALLDNQRDVYSLYAKVASSVERESKKMGSITLQQPLLDGNAELEF